MIIEVYAVRNYKTKEIIDIEVSSPKEAYTRGYDAFWREFKPMMQYYKDLNLLLGCFKTSRKRWSLIYKEAESIFLKSKRVMGM
ncbi:MAG: hypothetical protein ACYCS0_01065 [bacterium]